MTASDTHDVTGWLQAWTEGDPSALSHIVPIVHDELRRLAHHYMRCEEPGHILQTTALVDEAYMRLVDAERMDWRNRAHFLAISAKVMRQVLVDVARARRTQKRGGRAQQVGFDEAAEIAGRPGVDLESLHEALDRLSSVDPRKGRVVELRFFGGLKTREIAEVLGVSQNTVLADWSFSKAWLCREMRPG